VCRYFSIAFLISFFEVAVYANKDVYMDKSVFSFRRLLTTSHCPHLLLLRPAAATVDRYLHCVPKK